MINVVLVHTFMFQTMTLPLGLSASSDELQPPASLETESLLRTQSEPDMNSVKHFGRRKAARLRKKWLKQYYSQLSPGELEKVQEKLSERNRKEAEDSKGYKYGRWAMIALALFSIPVDGWKLYQGIERTERALDGPTSLDVFDYYSSAIATHVIGLAAAVDNNLILTIGCRMLSTVLYQTSYDTKGNSTVPTDPKQLQKYIRENVPAHRLPKGYRFTDDLNAKKGSRKRSKKQRKKTKLAAKKGKGQGKAAKAGTATYKTRSNKLPSRTKKEQGIGKPRNSKKTVGKP